MEATDRVMIMSTILCLRCGQDITGRLKDRTSLDGADTVIKTVVYVLECLVEDEPSVCPAVIQGDLSMKKMCRKCFSLYSRY